MSRVVVLPRLYCIVDAGSLDGVRDLAASVSEFARELIAGGATLLQYRNKSGNPRQVLADAREILRAAEPHPGAEGRPRLILNDRADLALLAGFDGVHVGQEDLSPEAVRRVFGIAGRAENADKQTDGHSATRNSVLGTRHSLLLGVSTHSPEQIAEADETSADYLAVGPVFATASKQNPDPVIGLEGVRRARQLTSKPLVAIGGITRQNCRSVLDAGADSVAVISDLLRQPRQAVEEFLRLLA